MAISLMVVDDAPELRGIIGRHFERIGCKVVAEAGDGAEAGRLFAEHRPALVTMDIVMPHKDGFDVLRTFRTIRSMSPETRIIVVSSALPATTRELFFAEGAFAFLEKPFGTANMRAL